MLSRKATQVSQGGSGTAAGSLSVAEPNVQLLESMVDSRSNELGGVHGFAKFNILVDEIDCAEIYHRK